MVGLEIIVSLWCTACKRVFLVNKEAREKMKIKIQVDAEKPNKGDAFYEGSVLVKIADTTLGAALQFTVEVFDGDGDSRPVCHIEQNDQPVFTPASLAGTHGVLEKLCRAGIDLAIDLIEEQSVKKGTYTGEFDCPDNDADEIKKFLQDTGGTVTN